MAKRKAVTPGSFTDRFTFGVYLAAVRNRLGEQPAGWAKKIGLTKSRLYSLEQGIIKKPDIETIHKIAVGYNLREEDVVKVFYGPQQDKTSEHARLDGLLDQIRKDRAFKDLALRAFSERPGLETKRLIIALYEKATGKNILK